MKKKILLIILSILIIVSTGVICYRNYLPNPNSNLEFWIAEKVNKADFKEHQMKYGMFGGNMYYGKGYIPTIDENEQQIDPEFCVIYTVTSYPDYIINSQHVTCIYITDPNIEFYGLSLNSSKDDIIKVMKKKSFSIEEGYGITATRGKYTFNFTEKSISIRVEVSNILGIQF